MKVHLADFLVIVILSAIIYFLPLRWHNIVFNHYPVIALLTVYWAGRYISWHGAKRAAAKQKA